MNSKVQSYFDQSNLLLAMPTIFDSASVFEKNQSHLALVRSWVDAIDADRILQRGTTYLQPISVKMGVVTAQFDQEHYTRVMKNPGAE